MLEIICFVVRKQGFDILYGLLGRSFVSRDRENTCGEGCLISDESLGKSRSRQDVGSHLQVHVIGQKGSM